MRNSSRISFAGRACAVDHHRAAVPAQDRNVTLTESQNGGSAELAKDQNLRSGFRQGGTGFSWELMRARAPVRLLSSNAHGWTLATSRRSGDAALCV
jgi:hypothetical protein